MDRMNKEGRKWKGTSRHRMEVQKILLKSQRIKADFCGLWKRGCTELQLF
jgi:hypothetical protein